MTRLHDRASGDARRSACPYSLARRSRSDSASSWASATRAWRKRWRHATSAVESAHGQPDRSSRTHPVQQNPPRIKSTHVLVFGS